MADKTPSGPDYEAAWNDLRERLINAAAALQGNSQSVGVGAGAERARLLAKKSGVNLARSYMEEWERTGFTLATPSNRDIQNENE